MNKNTLKMAAIIAALMMSAIHLSVSASDHGSEAEAVKMVKDAVALVKSAETEKAYKAFTDHPDNSFKLKDLYVFVYDFEGNCLAQGANPKMVGKNLLAMRDVDGNTFIKGMIDMVKASSKGWYGPYKFNNPATQSYELKKSYCERGAGETIICTGIYSGKG